MTIVYKLTDENGFTRNQTLWGENVTHTAIEDSTKDLCSDAWIHCYSHPILALLLNPIGADFKNPILWEAKGQIEKSDNGLKEGCRKLTTIRKLPVPKITMETRITFAILCAKAVFKGKEWNTWADNWLNNVDRTASAAYAAAYASAAASAASTSAAAAAAASASYAADAAYAAAYAAYASAADYAAYAAYASASAAATARINLAEIADKAMELTNTRK